MCFENVLEMLWKCANVRMCKCENEKECFSLTFVASYITKHGKTLAYLHILTFSHLHISQAFAHSHILTFSHLHISQAFAHSHILTFAHFPSISTMDTLEEMKEQLALLHQKLDNERIINDRLVRRVISRNAGRINRDGLLITIIAAIGIPYCIFAFSWMGISWLFSAVTAVFLLIAIIYTYYSHRMMRTEHLAACTLAEVTERIVRMKLLHARWLRFSIPFLIVWAIWFANEILSLTGTTDEERHAILIGGVVGGVIGAVMGIITYRRTQRLANEILDEIKDYSHDEN